MANETEDAFREVSMGAVNPGAVDGLVNPARRCWRNWG